MNRDATMIAAEMQDLAGTVSEVAAAIRDGASGLAAVQQRAVEPPNPMAIQIPPPVYQFPINVPPAPAPVIHVAAPEPPVINVAAPEVTVRSQVNVPAPVPVGYLVQITRRDSEGRIVEFAVLPIDNGS